MNNLYYECHVTIEPVFDERLELAKQIAEKWNFKIADLLLKKREEDTIERSQYDTFMTSRSTDKQKLYTGLTYLIGELQCYDFKIWRYKVELVEVDSNIDDVFNLIRR